jgi:16S rRNA (uracil1498-N3)-methyltransferase
LAPPLRVPVRGITAGYRDLDRDAARYVVRVHRAREGAHVLLFDPEARTEADAIVLDTGKDHARVRVERVRDASLLPSRKVALLQAVAKGDKMDAIIRDATELGATRIAPMTTSRAIAERASGRGRWLRIAVEAARQSGRGDVPEIADPLPFADAVAGAREALLIALVPDSALPLSARLREAAAARPGEIVSVAVAVGPEGGFDAAEVAALSRAGFLSASLGLFVLRTETAATAALAVIADLEARSPAT